MGLEILETPEIDPEERTMGYHSTCRFELTQVDKETRLHILEKVVSGRDVVEIACGVFGGIGELVVKYPCKSYLGVDRSVGDPNIQQPKVDVEKGEIYFGNSSKENLPCNITIPENLLSDQRVNYVFGRDAYTLLKKLDSESVVTVSTGFWHDALLFENIRNVPYVIKTIKELCRVTPGGEMVGLHEMLVDIKKEHPEKVHTFGTFFREEMERNGVIAHPVSNNSCENFFYLEKP